MTTPARAVAPEIASIFAVGARGFPSDYLDRARDPEETVALMWPRAAEFGLTRLAAVTGLDRIGIPVWAAMRPNSKSLALCQGKGVSDAAARASALMEAVEVATAEQATVPTRIATSAELVAEGRAFDTLETLLLHGATAPAADEPIAWFETHDLAGAGTRLVPLEAIRLDDATTPNRWWQSTDGLASGNTVWEATFHGLCERIERDALVLWSLKGDADVAAACFDPRELGDPVLDGLVDRIEAADMRIRLFDTTSDLGLPTHMAILSRHPSGHEDKWKHFDLASGSGCHPDPVRAAIRAVTEAAQSRLTSIAGARDDFAPEIYGAGINRALLPYVRAEPRAGAARATGRRLARDAYLPEMIAHMAERGVGDVTVAVLADGSEGHAVVKVIAPGLENPPGERRVRFGRRALSAALSARIAAAKAAGSAKVPETVA